MTTLRTAPEYRDWCGQSSLYDGRSVGVAVNSVLFSKTISRLSIWFAKVRKNRYTESSGYIQLIWFDCGLSDRQDQKRRVEEKQQNIEKNNFRSAKAIF